MTDVGNAEVYSPRKVLDHHEFRILAAGEKPLSSANIAAFYNPAHEIHLVEKPRPKPGPGQVLLHVRATGICGCVSRPFCRIHVFFLTVVLAESEATCISGNMVGLEIPWLLPMRRVLMFCEESVLLTYMLFG